MSSGALKGSARAPLSVAADQRRLAARKRQGRMFQALVFLPVALAILLILVLLGTVVLDANTWQVVELGSNSSGETFALAQAQSWREVVGLELAARGLSEEEMRAFFADPEELRKFELRSRVQLIYVPAVVKGPSGWRWTVFDSRDDVSENLAFLEGQRQLPELAANLGADERLFLNPWLDLSFPIRNNSGRALLAGLSTAILGSLWVIGLVILIAVPLGVGTAIYLEEYAPRNRLAGWLEVNLRNLAGVPSIVYGILGLFAFVRLLALGPTILAAALTLSLLILPVVVIAAREAIRAVPESLRLASYGLGATRWQTVSRVVLPNAVSGIVTGVILSVARAIGETAPLLLVGGAGFVTSLPDGPLSAYTVMPTQIYSWLGAPEAAFDNVAAAGILALLVALALLYALAFFVRRRFEGKG